VYYNNLKALKCITHSGDEQSGDKSGLDEVIWVGLGKLPATVKMILFVVATHTGHLRDVRNGMIHLLEEKQTNEVARFQMENSEEEVDLVAAMIRSDHGGWSFLSVDEPAQDGRHFIDILEPCIGSFVRKHIPSAPRRQKVAFAMEKGAVFDLPQSNAMDSISACLGWDVDGGDVDLDVSAVLFTNDGRALDAVFFGNLSAHGLEHSGDNLTGEGAGDDERITCNLGQIPKQVSQIFFIVNIYTKGVTFDRVSNAYCRILDNSTEIELARYTLSEGQQQNGLLIARLFREVLVN
jgi:tellurium resistance protein TerZ